MRRKAWWRKLRVVSSPKGESYSRLTRKSSRAAEVWRQVQAEKERLRLIIERRQERERQLRRLRQRKLYRLRRRRRRRLRQRKKLAEIRQTIVLRRIRLRRLREIQQQQRRAAKERRRHLQLARARRIASLRKSRRIASINQALKMVRRTRFERLRSVQELNKVERDLREKKRKSRMIYAKDLKKLGRRLTTALDNTQSDDTVMQVLKLQKFKRKGKRRRRRKRRRLRFGDELDTIEEPEVYELKGRKRKRKRKIRRRGKQADIMDESQSDTKAAAKSKKGRKKRKKKAAASEEDTERSDDTDSKRKKGRKKRKKKTGASEEDTDRSDDTDSKRRKSRQLLGKNASDKFVDPKYASWLKITPSSSENLMAWKKAFKRIKHEPPQPVPPPIPEVIEEEEPYERSDLYKLLDMLRELKECLDNRKTKEEESVTMIRRPPRCACAHPRPCCMRHYIMRDDHYC